MKFSEIFDEKKVLLVNKDVAMNVGVSAAVLFSAICKAKYDKNKKVIDEFGIVDIKEMQSKYIKGALSDDTILRLIKKLEKTGYLEIEEMTAEEIKNAVIKNKRNPKYVCEWCGNGCNLLNEHHYPIPRSKGGTKTVKICPNCHYEFHSMSKSKIIVKEDM